MSVKRRVPNNERVYGQDKRVQRVMAHLLGDFDDGSLCRVIVKQFKVPEDEFAFDVAQRITELHCNGEGYSDHTIAKLLRYVIRREPLPLEQRVLSGLKRYHYKTKELEFYFVLQEQQPGVSLLWFVDECGSRMPLPKGVTLQNAKGEKTSDMGGTFPFVWISHNELCLDGKCIVALEPQCSRVVSSGLTKC